MIARLLAKILGTANERELARLQPLVEKINAFENHIKSLSDQELSAKTNEFRNQLAHGRTLEDILPEAFAVVREASVRTIGQRHYDVQLIGGIVLHQGKIAEMKTGEGKTLTATLALYLNALTGNGAHLVTVNDYLAQRDATQMGKIYTFLGLSVGCLQNNMSDAERRQVYNNDILYATNNELGFDYLRDNMKFRLEDYVQRDLCFAIVDEVDSILIDEARTPLIISGAVEDSSDLYVDVNRVIARLVKNTDYEVNEKDRLVLLTEEGIDKIEHAFNIPNLFAIENLSLLHHVNQALRAHSLFKKDIEYVIKDNQVFIVDEFTGRVLPGRRYSDGLHQALEAKEGVTIEQESQTLASITLQNFFRMYKKLAGMTGTASTEAEEFHSIYKLPVMSIPTNKPMIRLDHNDLIFLNNRAKYKAIVEDVKARHLKGQPILIGTIAIETSERLSIILSDNGIKHDVLNAKQHAREAEIIEHAGEAGRVTIATNMAGRGTDIRLTSEALAAGGLYILGTERHESRRIDNQLRGRSGRQGDMGESRFYISLEDDLIRVFSGGDTLKKQMEWIGMKEDEVIESKSVSRIIERSQEKVEKHYYEMRKHLLEYDDVLNQQRIVIYQYRRESLDGENHVYELITTFIENTVEELTELQGTQGSFNQKAAATVLLDISKLTGISTEELEKNITTTNNKDTFIVQTVQLLLEQYKLLRNSEHKELFEQAEKWLILETIDQSWKQHMLNLDHLKEGIGLRGWGQKNPLIEYKREAYIMFQEMLAGIKQQVIYHIFRLNIERFDNDAIEEKRERELEAIQRNTHLSGEVAQPTARNAEPKIGRNDICQCGSGKKYKKCHGAT